MQQMLHAQFGFAVQIVEMNQAINTGPFGSRPHRLGAQQPFQGRFVVPAGKEIFFLLDEKFFALCQFVVVQDVGVERFSVRPRLVLGAHTMADQNPG